MMKTQSRCFAMAAALLLCLAAVLLPMGDASAGETAKASTMSVDTSPSAESAKVSDDSPGTTDLQFCISANGVVNCMEVPGTCADLGMDPGHWYPNATSHVRCN